MPVCIVDTRPPIHWLSNGILKTGEGLRTYQVSEGGREDFPNFPKKGDDFFRRGDHIHFMIQQETNKVDGIKYRCS